MIEEVVSGFTSSQITEEVTEIEPDEIKSKVMGVRYDPITPLIFLTLKSSSVSTSLSLINLACFSLSLERTWNVSLSIHSINKQKFFDVFSRELYRANPLYK